MNCLKYKNKKEYMDFVRTLSHTDLITESNIITNLYKEIKYEYNILRSNIYSVFIKSAKELVKDPSSIKEPFKWLLKETHIYGFSFGTVLKDFRTYNDDSDNEFSSNEEDPIKTISDTYDLIIKGEHEGYFNMINGLAVLIMNQSAIMYYKLYGEALIDEEELKKYDNSPKILFGGLDENGKPDYLYTLNRYIYQLDYDVDFVEGNI